MRTYSLTFASAGTIEVQIPGRYLEIVAASAPIDIEFIGANSLDGKATAVDAGTYAAPRAGFTGFKVTSASAQTVKFLLTNGVGGFRNQRLTLQLGNSITDAAPVVVGAAAVALVALGSGRKCVRFRNNGTVDVGLGSSGVTLVNAAIIISPGQTWNEADAPDAAWYGIASAAGNNVAIQILA